MPKHHKKGKGKNRPKVSSNRPRSVGNVFTMSTPASRRVRLVYPENFTLVEGAAGAGAFRFLRMNSLYDVDTAYGSTSVPGFAEWSAFYTNYRVESVAFKIQAAASGASAGTMAQVTFTPNPLQPVLPSNVESWGVQPGAIQKTILMYSNGGANRATLVKRYSMPKVFKVTREQFRSDFDFTATTSSSPLRQAYLAITVGGIGSSTPTTLVVNAWVSMEVEFFNPTLLSS
jgi:hypothetical protein